MLGQFRRHGLVIVRCPCIAPQLSGRTQEFYFFPLQMACPVTRSSASDSLDSQDSAPAIRDSFCFGSREGDSLTTTNFRKFNNSVMLLLGRRQQASTSSDMLMVNLLTQNITTLTTLIEFICLTIGILEAKKSLLPLLPKIPDMTTLHGR